MKQLLVALSTAALVFGTTAALADDTSLINEMNMKSLTAAQSAQFKTERDAAKAKWASMTPAEKSAATQSMKNKRISDMNYLDKFAENDDMTAMTKSETAQAKAEREAAEAKWTAMTAAEKAAARKATQQKRLADLNAMERAGQNDDMGQFLSY